MDACQVAIYIREYPLQRRRSRPEIASHGIIKEWSTIFTAPWQETSGNYRYFEGLGAKGDSLAQSSLPHLSLSLSFFFVFLPLFLLLSGAKPQSFLPPPGVRTCFLTPAAAGEKVDKMSDSVVSITEKITAGEDVLPQFPAKMIVLSAFSLLLLLSLDKCYIYYLLFF